MDWSRLNYREQQNDKACSRDHAAPRMIQRVKRIRRAIRYEQVALGAPNGKQCGSEIKPRFTFSYPAASLTRDLGETNIRGR